MKYTIEITKRFDRDLKRFKKKNYDVSILYKVIELIEADNTDLLINKYKDHKLYGQWEGFRELHLDKDWLLVYKKEENKLILTLTRLGSHDDLGLN